MKIECATLAASLHAATRLAALLKSGDCIALKGEVGAGKTTFCKAIIDALCLQPEEVLSPTFTLVHPYAVVTANGEKLTLQHFDLYRLEDPQELDELALEDAWEEGIALIEWPEIARANLPQDALTLHFEVGRVEQERTITVSADASWQERLKGWGDAIAIKTRSA